MNLYKALGRVGDYLELGGLPAAGAYLKYKKCKQETPCIIRKDLPFPCTIRLGTEDLSMYHQVIRNREYACSTTQPIQTIVDLGANVGFSVIHFAEHFPDAKIIAVEPDADNFALLKSNTQYYNNITCVQAAIWHTTETLHLTDLGSCGHRVDLDNASGVPVPGITMESLIDTYQINKIDLLKIDIEGAEKELFEHSQGWLDRVDSIVIELHDRFKRGCAKAFYDATSDTFHREWHRKENIFVAKADSPLQPI